MALFYFDKNELDNIPLPKRFTFPFCYTPHPLTLLAVSKLQNYLEHHFKSNHNFGLDASQDGLIIGKMFGVLVVRDSQGKIGYLWAFSGKLDGTNTHKNFVPPVFDMLTEGSFFLKQERLLNHLNHQLDSLENNPDYINLKKELTQAIETQNTEIEAFKNKLKQNKTIRKKQREIQKQQLSDDDYAFFEADLVKQSLRDKYELKILGEQHKQLILEKETLLDHFRQQIKQLREDRKIRSAELQNQLFEQYAFLNHYGKSKSLKAIFSETISGKPPAGAGECATPKLLQYAFKYHLEPLAMGEFWWGASPKSEIRKHKQFYPSCSGKCQPILKHMLEGIPTDKNPMLINPGANKPITILYEDDYIIVLNKPHDLLSVPGIHIKDSVYSRLQAKFKHSEPLMIHRLDMATSGLLVVAKTKDAHKHIQHQFLRQTVRKRYTALLSKIIPISEGFIDLPLRGNPDDRPRQLVCFEYGKKAYTEYRVLKTENSFSKIYFYPKTGRTHQLRMHASHHLGLNAPIVGDDLYGEPSDRLYLQASFLEFIHPKTNQTLSFEIPDEF